MKIEADGRTWSGNAIELSGQGLSAGQVVRAIRGDESSVRVSCPAPGSVHEHVGHVSPGMTLSPRAALAAAARSRGMEAPQDEPLAAVTEELAELSVPEADLTAARERVAEASGAERSHRERVAAARGRVQALREADADSTEAEAALDRAIRRLSEAETERVAAEQLLERARETARAARDERARQLRLQDRAGNLRRATRRHLAHALRDEFAAAVAAVPGAGTVDGTPSSFEGDDVTAALAVCRLADLDAPVVLSCGRFDAAADAAARLDAPVVRL